LICLKTVINKPNFKKNYVPNQLWFVETQSSRNWLISFFRYSSTNFNRHQTSFVESQRWC